ncbi:PadR family transcriptional regulator [Cellulomonas alba]|uniref:PadR family transcriptional regulator n=1 Tax=Cellulomonas alba TaxID=3053467 RepID=A0ABT7SFY9_9CELL|nr:PadR family transcriptional regulator [Cellulomonas alba]MDM7855090.1 PadR family transcriptional regulator [Cellulomonas alba]
MARSRSNPLALAVLALLWERPMHPYEMSMTLRERGKDESVRLNFGSLYSVVDSLEKHGLVAAASTEREGNRPQRTVYRITDEGSREVVDWLSDLLRTPTKEFPQFEAALSFLPLLPPDDAVRLLRLRVVALERRQAALRGSLDEAVATGLPPLFTVESEFEGALLRAELDFVTDLVTRLGDGTYPGVDLWRRFHADAGPDGRIDQTAVEEAVTAYIQSVRSGP